MVYTEEQLKAFRNKREAPANGRRAHFLCACGCPISAEKEVCPHCAEQSDPAPIGAAMMSYRRDEKKARFNVR